MATTAAPGSVLGGGAWLLETSASDATLTPERLSEEPRLMAWTAHEFVTRDVLPQLDRLHQEDWDLARCEGRDPAGSSRKGASR